LVVDNIYDVMALSPKLFILNEEVMMRPLLSDDFLRISVDEE